QITSWYSPRLNKDIQVLASVDEKSYTPNGTVKMGDHPVVWTNKSKKAKNIYIFMGHGPELFNNTAYTQLFRNALFWTAKP
ncbi:MAG: ThuA domain-containing protein, partial [Pedobacter sp.]